MKGIVFGLTFERASKELESIKANYAMCKIPIVKEIKGNHRHQIVYENGDIWTARSASDSARGHRANVVYIDHAIEDPDMIHMAHHCLCCFPWSAYRYFG